MVGVLGAQRVEIVGGKAVLDQPVRPDRRTDAREQRPVGAAERGALRGYGVGDDVDRVLGQDRARRQALELDDEARRFEVRSGRGGRRCPPPPTRSIH